MTLGGHEVIRLASSTTGWLADYERALTSTALVETSRQVVLEDSQFIADRAALDVDDARWGSSRVRTGVVMGAVQSGKTASMIGVVARSLDNGVNVVVVLAGTQVSLWQQSMGRIQSQLDGGVKPLLRRVFLPNPDDMTSSRRAGPAAAYGLPAGQASRALERGRPIIFVAMKQVDHLLHLGQVLHKVVFPAAASVGVPVRLLVVDDEADDSSIADDGLQWGALDLDAYKQTPRRIVDLWESRSQPGQTVSEHVFATYLAYTATPQANFLQDPENPLSPRDFVGSLRTPGPSGAVTPRTLTYRVPEGLRGWYTGADTFYGELAPELCVASGAAKMGDEATANSADAENADSASGELDIAEIVDATRAYLVAAAIRVSRASGCLGPTSARASTFASPGDVERRITPICSMLIHPSSAMESHFEVADALQGWWNLGTGQHGDGVLADMADNEQEWVAWVERYRNSSKAVSAAHHIPGGFADDRHVPEWDALRQLIVDEVVPGTTIAVVNSDPNADDRPSYLPWCDADGWHPPRNHSTIFVSGNVMSRGLTLEGLLTTLFTRRSSAPLADTQMQMQRWFGYRGAYIDLCRVFLSPEQLMLFARYADADHALRSQVLAAMESSESLPDFTVLQGHAFQATGKVTGLVGRQLRPGSRPFVRHLNPPGQDTTNLAVVSRHFATAHRSGRLKTDPRGLLALDDLSLIECAALLDQMRYSDHGLVPLESDRWRALERQAALQEGDPEYPLYRAPPVGDQGLDLGSRSPFVIAAYLRFWAACLDRDVRGVFTDDSPPQRWSLLNRDAKRLSQPRFRVAVRFGAGLPVSAGPFVDLSKSIGLDIRAMARDTTEEGLAALWGSREATATGYVGDDLFDASLLGEAPPLHADGTRTEGAPGLVLFHLIERSDAGGIAIGLSIPSGGPDHVEAVSTLRRRGTKTRAE
ncbi:Z1 domain-containing protein [Aquipuribacter hungaricus]|uniref:Z1 domain-containing protein n=1 Tax=Aquipuribacter hungaricus TaxID=545624 RepID=A0ABV7WDB4_9MICO